jgi:hypothetical protein
MVSRAPSTRGEAIRECAFAVLTAVACAALLCAAALAPAPPAALPFLVVLCVICPMAATWSVPASIALLRTDARAVAQLRRSLEELPETTHPLGF